MLYKVNVSHDIYRQAFYHMSRSVCRSRHVARCFFRWHFCATYSVAHSNDDNSDRLREVCVSACSTSLYFILYLLPAFSEYGEETFHSRYVSMKT
jgi:hypothetical protein